MFRLLITFFFLYSQFSLADNSVLVGVASTDVTPAVGEHVPLGGYGGIERRDIHLAQNSSPIFRLFREAKGKLDDIRAKAMYVNKNGKKLLFISLDVVGVTRDIHTALVDRLSADGFSPESIFISGTHTHAGPGGLSNNLFWQVVAMDRFMPEFYKHYIDQVVDTAKAAVVNAQTGELFTLSFMAEGLVHNRRGRDRPLFPKANLILARGNAGDWLGGIVNYAVHGTHFGENNLFFSSDVPGAIERELQNYLANLNGYFRPLNSPTMLFVNGAEGDVSPDKDYLELAQLFTNQTSSHWEDMKPLVPDWTVVQKEITMPKPKIALAKCVQGNWMPKKLSLGVKKWIKPETLISQLHFGNLWIMTWPGEATTELGTTLMAQARELGAEDAWVFGLTNDHLSYFVTAEEFEKGGYETCSTFYGTEGGSLVINYHRNLSKKIVSKK